MHRLLNRASPGGLLAWGGLALVLYLPAVAQAAAPALTTIRSINVLNRGNNFELEIEASQPIVPQTQVITGPDRLVIDIPHAVPGRGLHSVAVNSGQVKRIRVGLFESNPPIARVVVDLKSPRPYQVFPSGRSVIVKITGNGGQTAASPTPAVTRTAAAIPAPPVAPVPTVVAPPPPPPPPQPKMRVAFRNGQLSIWADHASLAEVLREVHRLTGAAITIPPGADQQPIFADLGPGSPRQVLTSLLNGSPYNVILVGSGRDLSQITSVILSPRGSEGVDMPANYSPAAVAQTPPEPASEIPPPPEDNSQPEPPPPDTDAPPQQ
jgi:AMIN domain